MVRKVFYTLYTLARFEIDSPWTLVGSTDIHQRSQTSYTTLCNGVVSHGALWVFAIHTQKYKCVHNLGALCGVLRLFVFTFRSGYIGIRRTTVILITGKNRKTPKISLMMGSRWCRLWDLWSISVVGSKLHPTLRMECDDSATHL